MQSNAGGVFDNVQQTMQLLGTVKGRIEPVQQGTQ
jgi:hypothetical protein